jgi:hypothetical protein
MIISPASIGTSIPYGTDFLTLFLEKKSACCISASYGRLYVEIGLIKINLI